MGVGGLALGARRLVVGFQTGEAGWVAVGGLKELVGFENGSVKGELVEVVGERWGEGVLVRRRDGNGLFEDNEMGGEIGLCDVGLVLVGSDKEVCLAKEGVLNRIQRC